jgi:hypothetical protein
MKKLIKGVGINDVDYKVKPIVNGKRIICPYYERWLGILKRCYEKQYQDRFPSYIGCEVSEEWKYFSNFKYWMEQQDWEKNHLDKDILFPGNKIYSSDTCIFVSGDINLLFHMEKTKVYNLPLGVTYRKDIKKYHCQINKYGNKINLGNFNCPIQAHRKYQIEKSKYIIEISEKQIDKRLKSALLRISSKIEDDIYNKKETTTYF